MSTPELAPPAVSPKPRTRRRLLVALVLIAIALTALMLVDRFREPPAVPSAPHEPSQALIVPPQAATPPAQTGDTAAGPPDIPQQAPPPPVVINEGDRPSALSVPRSRDEPAADAGSYLVQAGMFTSATNAQALQRKLTKAGLKARVETRVQLGPFKDKAEADQAAAKLRKLGISSVLVPSR